MFGLFEKENERVTIEGLNIFIDNQTKNVGQPIELNHVFKFTDSVPKINVFENKTLTCSFEIEALKRNPDLFGQFLHSSIRIQLNSAVMIDGIISNSDQMHLAWNDENYEAIRFQPFFLSDHDQYNPQLIGKGLFERGLHFAGTITPLGVRCVCICDSCKTSFTIQHTHAGFSEAQYFYSADSKETLLVPYNAMVNIPAQLQKDIDEDVLKEVESNLPDSSDGKKFRYYNSFNCPHCLTPYINFEKHKEIRAGEYYANTYINEKARWLTKG